MANPSKHSAGPYPETRRDDQPEDPPEERSVVDLANARDDEGKDGGNARVAAVVAHEGK